MTILVTGAAGFIGSHLVDELLKRGYDVIGVDNLSNGKRENLLKASEHNNFTFICDDLINLTKGEIWLEAEIDFIYHLAARGGVPASLTDPTATFFDNTVLTHAVLEFAAHEGVQGVVFASSSSVYGDNSEKVIRHDKVCYGKKNENHSTRPKNPYGVSKLVGELYGKTFYDNFKLPFSACRFFNVYGPRQRHDIPGAAVIPTLIQKALKGEDLFINGDSSTSRDFTYVFDVVEGLCQYLITDKEKWQGQIYNLCRSSEVTLLELAQGILEYIPNTKSKSKIVSGSSRPGDIKNSCGDNFKFMSTFRYKPSTSFNNGLLETINYYKGQYIGYEGETRLVDLSFRDYLIQAGAYE